MIVESEWKSMLDALTEPRMLIRSDRTVAYANRAFRDRYGYSVVEGRHCHELLFHDAMPCETVGRHCPMFDPDFEGRGICYHKVPGPMGVRYIETELTPVRGSDGRVRFFMERVSEAEGTRARTGGDIVVQSKCLAPVLEEIGCHASSDSPVVFVGEKGVGKTLFARVLHENGRRAARPFVSLSCESLTADDLERELLGSDSSNGLLDVASGGTLFFSDVDRLEPSLCSVLLQLAVHGTYRVRGMSQVHFSNLRLVFSCERFDSTLALPKNFLYALAPYVIRIPPLRERFEDVPIIASRFLFECTGKTLSDEAQGALFTYSWPGNLPELKAVLQSAALATRDPIISRATLEASLDYISQTCSGKVLPEETNFSALAARWKGSRAELARFLGVSERTLYRKLRALSAISEDS